MRSRKPNITEILNAMNWNINFSNHLETDEDKKRHSDNFDSLNKELKKILK